MPAEPDVLPDAAGHSGKVMIVVPGVQVGKSGFTPVFLQGRGVINDQRKRRSGPVAPAPQKRNLAPSAGPLIFISSIKKSDLKL